jgi:hypothetical protein
MLRNKVTITNMYWTFILNRYSVSVSLLDTLVWALRNSPRTFIWQSTFWFLSWRNIGRMFGPFMWRAPWDHPSDSIKFNTLFWSFGILFHLFSQSEINFLLRLLFWIWTPIGSGEGALLDIPKSLIRYLQSTVGKVVINIPSTIGTEQIRMHTACIIYSFLPN